MFSPTAVGHMIRWPHHCIRFPYPSRHALWYNIPESGKICFTLYIFNVYIFSPSQKIFSPPPSNSSIWNLHGQNFTCIFSLFFLSFLSAQFSLWWWEERIENWREVGMSNSWEWIASPYYYDMLIIIVISAYMQTYQNSIRFDWPLKTLFEPMMMVL